MPYLAEPAGHLGTELVLTIALACLPLAGWRQRPDYLFFCGVRAGYKYPAGARSLEPLPGTARSRFG